MDLKVHDLLRLREPDVLVSRGPVPEWVSEALARAPWVVVRRAPVEGEFVPVGVRGQSRSERFPAHVRSSSIVEWVSPESCALQQGWKKSVRREELPAMCALFRVHTELRTSDLAWGPVGSVGFELVTGLPVVEKTSDLDLIIRIRDLLIPTSVTQKLLVLLEVIGVGLDLLLETGQGAISFQEYRRDEPKLVLRTVNGPILIPHPEGRSPQRESAEEKGRTPRNWIYHQDTENTESPRN
jgi:phosphoribosyl-dephospho-CoA transferase